MKILHIISGDLWAGAEVQAFTLLTALRKHADVEVAAALLNDGELARRLRQQGIPVIIFSERRYSALRILQGLRRLIHEWRPDVIHTHRIKENILGTLANLLSLRRASVRTVHGAGEHSMRGVRNLPRRLLRRLDIWCGTRLQQRIIAVSDELALRLAEDFPRDKITVVENGVDVEAVLGQVRPVEFRTEAPTSLHIGIVGRLVPVKRLDLFLATAALLIDRHPERNWRFHVFGDGPLQISLAAQAASLQLTDAVTFHGHRSDVIACIAALDALIMCSDHEGLPMTILEALVTGTPIVAHAVGGLPRILEGVGVAILVNGHRPIDYAMAIEDVLDSETRAQNSSRNQDNISATENAARMLGIYNAALQAL